MKTVLLFIGICLVVIVNGKGVFEKKFKGKDEIYPKDVKPLTTNVKDVSLIKTGDKTKLEKDYDKKLNKDNIPGNNNGDQKEIYHKDFHREHFGNYDDYRKGDVKEHHKYKHQHKWIHHHTEHHKEHVKNKKKHDKRKQKGHHIKESKGQYKEHHKGHRKNDFEHYKEHGKYDLEHHKNHLKQRDHKKHTYHQKKNQDGEGRKKYEDKHKKGYYGNHKGHHKEHQKENHENFHEHYKTNYMKTSKQQHEKFHKDITLGMRHKTEHSKDEKTENDKLKQHVPVKYDSEKTEKYVKLFHGKETDKSQKNKNVKDINDKTKMKEDRVSKQIRKKKQKNRHLKHGKHQRKLEKQNNEKFDKLNGKHVDDYKEYKFVKTDDRTNEVRVVTDKKQKNNKEKANPGKQKLTKFVNKSEKIDKPTHYQNKSKKLKGKHRKGVGCKKIRNCPTKRRPVCGNDGITYDSKCQLKLAACRKGHRKAILLVHHGECKAYR